MCGESNGYPMSDKSIEGLNRLATELKELTEPTKVKLTRVPLRKVPLRRVGFPSNMILNLSTGQTAQMGIDDE